MGSGQSIGDLFVRLGFEVDDSKLKSFNNDIKDVFNTALKFAGIGGGVAGFIAVAKGASDTALQLQNLASVYGTATKAAQAWGAAVHEANPLKSYKEGLASFGSIAQYLSNAAFTGQGSIALNRLGVRFRGEDIQHPEKAIDQLFDRIPQLLAQHPNNRSLYSNLIGQLTGDPANIQIFERGRGFADAAAQRATVLQADLDKTTEARRSIAALGDAWDKFISHAIGTLVPHTTGFLEGVQKEGFFTSVGKGLSAFGTDMQGRISGFNNRAGAATYWKRQGYSDVAIAALLAQEQAESSFNPRAGAGTAHQGIAQWSAARRARILNATGIDISTASHSDQLRAEQWELQQMGLDKQLNSFNSRSEASQFLSRKYEMHEKYNAQHGDEAAYRARIAEKMPEVNITVNQTIHSNADAEEVARQANQRIQDQVTNAFRQRIGVNP